MDRRVGVVGALACLLPILTVLVAPPAQAARAVDDPISVRIRSLSPAVIPQRGPIVLSGVIANDSTETWTELRVYPWRSTQPITGLGELALAAETDPALGVGTRIVDTSAAIDSLEPGQSASFRVRIPRDRLGIEQGAAGVYWIGVQVLGSSSAGRDLIADGRARTFIPLVGRRPSVVSTAIVIPIRHRVAFTRTGSLTDEASWLEALGPDGHLRGVLDLLAEAPSGDVTVVVDPAVLDAVRRLADGNPPRDLGPVDEPGPNPTGSPSPTAEISRSSLRLREIETVKHYAATWLADFTAAAKGLDLLALPYADLDVDAAAQHDPELIERAAALSTAALKRLGLSAPIVVMPPSGHLSPSTIAAIPASMRILVSDAVLAARAPDPADDPTSVQVGERILHLTNAAASTGGPLPGNPHSALQLRQRILAEAALRAADTKSRALIVAAPSDWDPGTAGGNFFTQLDRDWLALVPEATAHFVAPGQVPATDLTYPERAEDLELDESMFVRVHDVIAAGRTLGNILARPTDVTDEVAAQAIAGASYARRVDQTQSLLELDLAERFLTRYFRQIRIAAPPYVTLSSTSGRFRVDLANDLEYAVTVRIEALTDPALTIEAPAEVELAGQSRTTVLVNARSAELGVHEVTLLVTDVDGTPLGPQDSLPIRANQVGKVIWVIIGSGLALLFVAIVLRLVRRFRRRGEG